MAHRKNLPQHETCRSAPNVNLNFYRKKLAPPATSGFTTYELYLTYNYAQLYIDGILVIDNVPKATGGDTDRIEFGVLAAGQGDGKGAGDVSYEYVKWGNNMALVPEPSGAALIFLGIFGVLLTRRCRHATISHSDSRRSHTCEML